ncbi:MAG: Uma2 family endonuclease [Synechocystis sp.]
MKAAAIPLNPPPDAMIQLAPKLLTIEKFLADYGDDENYELIDGELIAMEPTGAHEQVTAFLARKLNVEIDRQNLPYFIPHRCLIKLLGTQTAFRPDLIILDQRELSNEPLWQKEPVITQGKTIKLVAEVVSSNWQNDYARKLEDYALLGIKEYWIIDYLALGGRDYIGRNKRPTITICNLVEDEYDKKRFQNGDRLTSILFPDLSLSASQIFHSIS